MSKLIHIADRVLNRPLMILPDKLALIAQVLEGRIGLDATDLKGLDVDAHLREGPDASRFTGSRMAADGTRKPYSVQNGVAVISVLGSLVNRGAWIGAYSGMTSYEGIGHQLDTAAADPDVSKVVLDLDSPGGEAVGAFEVADKVRSLAAVKEVVAIVNGMAASAAYAIASAASKIITTPSAVSGSIGVVLMHADYSQALHAKGVKPTLIHAGAHKVDGNPYEPLSENVKADLKAEVDQFYSLFVSSVAKGRKGRMTEKSVRGTEARTFIGQAAVDAGLADAVGSFQTVLADLSRRGTVRTQQSKRLAMDDDKTHTQAEVDAAVTAAVTTAKTEAAAAATAAKAEHDTALAAARGEGVKAERERIKGILGSDEAKGREKSALHMALTTSLSLDETKAALAGVAKDTAPAAGSTASHGLFLSEQPAAASKKAAEDGWADVIAETNKLLKK